MSFAHALIARADTPSPSLPAPTAEDPGGGGGWLWAQMIEKEPGSNNKTFPLYYYQGQYYCNNDSDIDYTMVYSMNYNRNPDSLRFFSDHWIVQGWPWLTALKGYSYTWDKVHVCAGSTLSIMNLMMTIYLHQ